MSDALLIFLAAIISTAATFFLTRWTSKRKVPAEVKEIDSKSNLNNGELIKRYQEIATTQADENIELSTQIKNEKAEKRQLAKDLENLRNEMLIMDQRHNFELEALKMSFTKEQKELRDSVETDRIEHAKVRAWAERLVLQLRSWDLEPTPYDIEKAKQEKLSLGDMGKCV